MTASAPSFSTMCAAVATACSPDEQKRLTVWPAHGHRQARPSPPTLRPALKPCGPFREAGAHDDVVDLGRIELRRLLQHLP